MPGSHTARQVIDYLSERKVRTLVDGLEYHKARHNRDRGFQVWQEGSHPRIIETEKVLRQKLEYVHMNPVKRRYVSDPTHWGYSSDRNYAGIEASVPVGTESWVCAGGDAERRGLSSHAGAWERVVVAWLPG